MSDGERMREKWREAENKVSLWQYTETRLRPSAQKDWETEKRPWHCLHLPFHLYSNLILATSPQHDVPSPCPHLLTQSRTHTHTHTLKHVSISVMNVQFRQWLLSSDKSPTWSSVYCICSYLCACVCICMCGESEMVKEGDEMEDYYLVYCIYILSILSFPPGFSLFVIVRTLLPVFEIPTVSCDASDILLSKNITLR